MIYLIYDITANADFKHPTNDNNGIVIPAKIPCNGQPEKDLGCSNPAKGLSTTNKPESNFGEDNKDVDMVILDQIDQEHQVPKSLGDSVPEKLAGVVTKYWQYGKPEKFSVIKILNEKFLIPANCDEICVSRLDREIPFSKNITPWVKKTDKRLRSPKRQWSKPQQAL